ncbi:hypothetical protein C8R45DRAFT_1004875 [Mycena sanguinolenta]|nr:hypothetical protein C8R45DRAFT_1004875 [Mycena sanguinolenta]
MKRSWVLSVFVASGSASRWMARWSRCVSLSTLTNNPTRGCKVRRAAAQAVKVVKTPSVHHSDASTSPALRRARIPHSCTSANTRAARQPTAHVSSAPSSRHAQRASRQYSHSTLHASRPPRVPASCASTTPHSTCASVYTLRTRTFRLLGSSRAGRARITIHATCATVRVGGGAACGAHGRSADRTGVRSRE